MNRKVKMPHGANMLEFRLRGETVKPLRGHLRMGTARDPAGDRLEANSRWLEWNGRPIIPVMGEFHYSRYPAELWAEELRKIRAGGITWLATYVFWNHHEEMPGRFDWSGRRDLRRFVRLAAAAGLRVALRIGPFCHGEVRNGGIPDWVYGQPFEIRSNDPRYLALATRLYRQIYRQLRGLFFANGGPIVAVQVENEYLSTGALWETTHFPDTEWQTAGAGGETHMGALRELAEAAGFNPALWVCTGWGATRFPADRFLPLFGGYAYYGWQDDPENHECSPNFIYRDMWTQAHRRARLPYDPLRVPYACCEIGGGMQPYYRHRPRVPPASVTAMNNVILGNGSNLMGTYVYHGGVNPRGVTDWLNEYRVPRRSYDYQAPLGEFGQRRPHYDGLRRLYLFIDAYQKELARAAPTLPQNQPPIRPDDTRSVRAAVRTNDAGWGCLFLNNFQDHARMPSRRDVRVTVRGPRGRVCSFPAVGRMDLDADANLMLPFGFDLDGVKLKQGGVTPMAARRAAGQPPVFFFFSPRGLTQPHYVFSGGVKIAAAGDGVEVLRRGAETIVCVPSDGNTGFTVTARAGAARIVTLTEADSLAFWQENSGGAPLTLLTRAGVIFHEDGIELYQIGSPEFRWACWTDGVRRAWRAAVPLDEGELKLGFTHFRAAVPAWKGRPTITPLKAGKCHVALGASGFRGAHDVFLRVRYQGDTGMAFVNGELVHDHFHDGRPWEIGLRSFRPAVEKHGVVLRVVPKPSAEGSCTQDAMGAGALNGGDFKNVAIEDVTAVPEYRLRLHMRP